jgi:biopolymer transport protein ExbD
VAGSADEESAISDINITPMVDICLVLVIILMVVSPSKIQSGIIVNSSKVSESVGKSTKSEAVNVRVSAKGIIINNKNVTDENAYAALKGAIDANKKKLVMVTSDRKASHGRLVWVLDTAKMSGAKTLSIMREDKGTAAAE